MKKFLITFLYAVLFLSINFTDVKIDAYAKNIGSNEKALVEIKDEAIAIENNLEEEEKKILEQQEIKRLQQEEAKKQRYSVIQTSTYSNTKVSFLGECKTS